MAAKLSQGARRPLSGNGCHDSGAQSAHLAPTSGNVATPDARIAEAVRRSDSLELVSRDELLQLFADLAESPVVEVWVPAEGGAAC